MAEQKYYTWDHIGELAGKRLLDNDEKIAVCRKISAGIHKPSTAAAIAVKVFMFIAGVFTLFGISRMGENNVIIGFIIFMVSLYCLTSALLVYAATGMARYDEWRAQEKEIMKRDVYRVPVMIGDVFQMGGKKKSCYAHLKYTEDKNFQNPYRISEHVYQHAGEIKLYCCYYEASHPGHASERYWIGLHSRYDLGSRRHKYSAGKYQLFFIDENQ